MNIPSLVGVVAVVTEIIKKLLLKIHVEIKGFSAVILAVIVSAGVVVVKSLMLGEPLGIQTLWIFLQVAFGATIGYAIVTKKSETKSI